MVGPRYAQEKLTPDAEDVVLAGFCFFSWAHGLLLEVIKPEEDASPSLWAVHIWSLCGGYRARWKRTLA